MSSIQHSVRCIYWIFVLKIAKYKYISMWIETPRCSIINQAPVLDSAALISLPLSRSRPRRLTSLIWRWKAKRKSSLIEFLCRWVSKCGALIGCSSWWMEWRGVNPEEWRRGTRGGEEEGEGVHVRGGRATRSKDRLHKKQWKEGAGHLFITTGVINLMSPHCSPNTYVLFWPLKPTHKCLSADWL